MRDAAGPAPRAGDDAGIAVRSPMSRIIGCTRADGPHDAGVGRRYESAHHRGDRRGGSRWRATPIISCCSTAWCTSSTRSAACWASPTGWTSPISARTGYRRPALRCDAMHHRLGRSAGHRPLPDGIRLLRAGPAPDSFVSVALPAQHADAAHHRERRPRSAARLAHRGVVSYAESFKEELHAFPRLRHHGRGAAHLGRGCLRDIALCQAVVAAHRRRLPRDLPTSSRYERIFRLGLVGAGRMGGSICARCPQRHGSRGRRGRAVGCGARHAA